MGSLFRTIDDLLRGRYTRREDLLAGRIEVPLRTLIWAGLLLGAVYGVFMGLFAVLRTDSPSFAQLAATTAKVPLLFLLTLIVTFPSLYVFSALVNSRLRSLDTLRLLLAAVAVNLALLASLGPVTGFFTLSTDSYPFMVTLNVVFFGICGVIGLGFLRKALRAVFSSHPPAPAAVASAVGADSAAEGEGAAPTEPATPPPPPPLEHVSVRRVADRTAKRVFSIWTVIYGIVGAQMGWILRPFVGTPDQPFELFRERESNFFEALRATLERLFG